MQGLLAGTETVVLRTRSPQGYRMIAGQVKKKKGLEVRTVG